MQNFVWIANIDVLPLRLQLDRHPELWDQHTARTTLPGSAHTGLSDLWLRWRPPAQLEGGASYNEPFAELQWYPSIVALPAAREILMQIMGRIGATAMGGALITKIPPAGAVKPHSDAAAWHARYYTTKVYTVIETNPNVVNFCAGERYVPKAGDVFAFDNLKEHSVYNEGDSDRITLIAGFRGD